MVHPDNAIETLSNAELADLLATAAEVTARSVREATAFVPAVSRVVASGGGVRNRAVMSRLSEFFSPVPVVSLSELGMDPDGRHGNVPAATGAAQPVVLGKVSPGL